MDSQYEAWLNALRRLRQYIEARLGRKVDLKPLKNKYRPYGIEAPRNFANVLNRDSYRVLRLSTCGDWAKRANVAECCGGWSKDNAFRGYPATYWEVPVEVGVRLDERLKQLAGILAKVCEARHV